MRCKQGALKRAAFCCLLGLCGPAPAQVELDDMVVEGEADTGTSEDIRKLERGAANATLGSFLDDMPNVDSASYGEGVGRPVVRGMTGYRVKILQNDNEVSDLSAMSQDHAVAISPVAAERIELLKGPASLVYAAQSGGVIRISDAMDFPFKKPGLHGEVAGNLRADPAGYNLNGRVSQASDTWAFQLSAVDQFSDPYIDGNGDRVIDSDVNTQQAQAGVGWRPTESGEFQFHSTLLRKEYGIPNRTIAPSRIDMSRDDFGLRYIHLPALSWLDEWRVDLLSSDYLHFENEGGRQDGAFSQEQANAAVVGEWVTGSWRGESRLAYVQSELQVCHEHGACDDFQDAVRTGREPGESVLQQAQNNGLPFSHGNPLPTTNTQTVQASTAAVWDYSTQYEVSLGANVLFRDLSADPAVIQEQWVFPAQLDPDFYRDEAEMGMSMSASLKRYAQAGKPGWVVSLSYIERLPSVDELFWNGYHHATDTYLFGDRDLNTERSLNLDLDVIQEWGAHRVQLSAFYYDFGGYIFQDQGFDENGERLRDPFHLSNVWFTRQTDAVFFGGSIRYEHDLSQSRSLPMQAWFQADVLDARQANGDDLPRTAPANTELGLSYESQDWSASLSWRHVFDARVVAPNETDTDGYDWVSLFVSKTWSLGEQNLALELKAENLLDAFAQNHISVIKDTAPLPGRQVFAGLRWSF